MKVSISSTIRRTPEDVFAFLANRTNLPQWAQGVAAVRKTSNEAVGAGSRFRIEGRLAGKLIPSVYEITAYEPWTRLSGRNSGLLSFDETYDLRAIPEGTEVRQEAQVHLEGHFLFLAPLLRLVLSAQLRKDFANLRRVLEAPAPSIVGSEPATGG